MYDRCKRRYDYRVRVLTGTLAASCASREDARRRMDARKFTYMHTAKSRACDMYVRSKRRYVQSRREQRENEQ